MSFPPWFEFGVDTSGIVHVDPQTRMRTPQKSAGWHRDAIAAHHGGVAP